MNIEPIGIYRNRTTNKAALPRQGTLEKFLKGQIKVHRDYAQGLSDLKGIQRVWLIFGFHKNTSWKPLVLPPTSKKKRGVFATRSPYRPNFLGLTCCEILKVEGDQLFLKGADLLDETPIYDIKPYLPYADAFPKSKTGWIEKEERKKFSIAWTKSSLPIKRAFLKGALFDALQALEQQLSYHPTDSKRKRVKRSKTAKTYVFSYRYLRWNFELDSKKRKVKIISALSEWTTDLPSTDEDVKAHSILSHLRKK